VRNPGTHTEARKFFYQSNRKSKTPKVLRFSADVPLQPGANYVTVFARENNDVQASELVVIFRKQANPVARRVKAAAVQKLPPTKTR